MEHIRPNYNLGIGQERDHTRSLPQIANSTFLRVRDNLGASIRNLFGRTKGRSQFTFLLLYVFDFLKWWGTSDARIRSTDLLPLIPVPQINLLLLYLLRNCIPYIRRVLATGYNSPGYKKYPSVIEHFVIITQIRREERGKDYLVLTDLKKSEEKTKDFLFQNQK